MRTAFFAAIVVSSTWASTARAQAEPPTAPEAPTQHAEKPPEAPPEEDVSTWAASLGGILNTGNTRAWQLTAGSELRLVRGPHAVGADLTFAYGQADLPDDDVDRYEDTVRNFTGKARYDYFFTTMDAVFVAAKYRWDTFAGISRRVQGQLGYLRLFVKEEKQRFWGEVGYDLTFDKLHFVNPDYDKDDPMETDPHYIDDRLVTHSARVFLGYDNKVKESLTYVGGLEGLFSVEDAADYRIGFDNALRSAINGNLQLEVKFTLAFDHVPVPGKRKVDTVSQVTLIYSLL